MRQPLSEKRRAKRELRESMKDYNEAQRIAQAMALSGLYGNVITHGWPVVWSREYCMIYSPPASGTVDDAYLKHRSSIVGDRYERLVGIQLLANCWDQFSHIGQVPEHGEIREVRSNTPDLTCGLPRYEGIPYNHGADKPSEPIASATPLAEPPCNAPAAPCRHASDESVAPIGVTSWLMDSGTPLDAIDRQAWVHTSIS